MDQSDFNFAQIKSTRLSELKTVLYKGAKRVLVYKIICRQKKLKQKKN